MKIINLSKRDAWRESKWLNGLEVKNVPEEDGTPSLWWNVIDEGELQDGVKNPFCFMPESVVEIAEESK